MRLAAGLFVAAAFALAAHAGPWAPRTASPWGAPGSSPWGDAPTIGGGNSPTFDLNFADGSGVSAIRDIPLIVNGTTLTRVLAYDGADATTTTWASYGGSGPTITHTGLGAVSVDRAAPFTDGSRAATGSTNGNGGRWRDATDTTTGNIGASTDFVVEGIWCSTSTAAYSGKSSGSGEGWFVGSNGVGSLNAINVNDGAVSRSITVSGGAVGQCNHTMAFGDHSEATAANGFVGYSNGTNRTTGTGALNTLGAIDNANAFQVSGLDTTTDYNRGLWMWVAMWTCEGCFAGGATNLTQWDAVAAERQARLVGMYADVAAGSAVPLQATLRASAAVVDIDRDEDGVRRTFTVGSNWLRTVKRPDTSAILRTGYLSEPQATNLMLQSQDFATTWAKIDAGDTITVNASASPDQLTTADALIGDATDGQHGVTQVVTVTATNYTLTVFAKAGSQGHLYVSNDTVANATSFFDLSPCGVGTNGAGASGEFVEDYGAGWCRVGFSFTGTAAAHTFRVGCAPADADNTFAGDGATTSCALWGAQLEATGWPTSYVATTTASATRVQDILHYSPTSNVASTLGTMEIAYQCDNYGLGLVAANLRAGGASDGSGNAVSFTSDSGNWGIQYLRASVVQAAVGAATSSVLIDGSLNTLRAIWGADDVRYWFDGAATGTPDTSATMVADGTFTRIAVLNNGAASSSASGPCVTTRARIWGSKVTP